LENALLLRGWGEGKPAFKPRSWHSLAPRGALENALLLQGWGEGKPAFKLNQERGGI